MAESISKITYILDASQANAEAAKLDANLEGIGKAAKSSAVGAVPALNSVSAATAKVGGSTVQLQQLYENVARSQGASSRAALDLAAAMGLQTQQAAQGAAANNEVGAAALRAARAEQEQALAQTEVAATGNISAGMAVRGAVAFDRLTGVTLGAGRSMSVLANVFSAATLSQFALIIGIGFLIGKLVELARAKEDQIKLDQDQISLDAQRNAAMQTGNLFTAELARTLHDETASNAILLKAKQQLSVARAEEADAIRGTTSVYHDLAGSTTDLTQKLGYYIAGLFAETKTQTQATADRLTAQKTMEDEVNARIRVAAETGKTQEALAAELGQILNNTQALRDLVIALDQGAFAQARYRAGQSKIEEIRTKVAVEAAQRGEVLKHAEAVRQFTAEAERQGAETAKLARETLLAEKNRRAFNETQKSGAGAARQLALAENSLTRELRDAQAALIGDDFAARAQKIKNDIDAERNALQIKKRLNQQTFDDLASLQVARLEKVNQDRVLAEQRFQDKLRQMSIAGITDDVDRRRAEIDFEVEKQAQALIKEFGLSKDTTDKILAYRRAAEVTFFNFLLQRTIDNALQVQTMTDALARQMARSADAEFEKTSEAFFRTQAERFKREQQQIVSLTDRFIKRGFGTEFVLPDPTKVSQAVQELSRLGLSVDDVDRIFGSSSRTIEQFQNRLDILNGSVPRVSAGMKEFFTSILTSLNFAQEAFQAFGNAVSQFFEGLVTGEQNAKAAFLSFLADILTFLGQAALAAGTVMLFLPGFHGLGIGLIAAGIAALALAGVLRGLASNAQKRSVPTAGAGGGTAATPAAGVESHPGQVIPFPTTGQGGPSQITIIHKWDQGGMKKALKGEEFVTVSDIRSPSTPAARAIRKAG